MTLATLDDRSPEEQHETAKGERGLKQPRLGRIWKELPMRFVRSIAILLALAGVSVSVSACVVEDEGGGWHHHHHDHYER